MVETAERESGLGLQAHLLLERSDGGLDDACAGALVACVVVSGAVVVVAHRAIGLEARRALPVAAHTRQVARTVRTAHDAQAEISTHAHSLEAHIIIGLRVVVVTGSSIRQCRAGAVALKAITHVMALIDWQTEHSILDAQVHTATEPTRTVVTSGALIVVITAGPILPHWVRAHSKKALAGLVALVPGNALHVVGQARVCSSTHTSTGACIADGAVVMIVAGGGWRTRLPD